VGDNLSWLVIVSTFFLLYVYTDVIVDIAPQLIALKSDKYHKNNIQAYKYLQK
jgi:hypothetical protein